MQGAHAAGMSAPIAVEAVPIPQLMQVLAPGAGENVPGSQTEHSLCIKAPFVLRKWPALQALHLELQRAGVHSYDGSE